MANPAPLPDSPAWAGPGPAAAPGPGRLTLIGAGHVFRIEQTIRDAIHALRPDLVFVELDPGRLGALLERQRTGGRMPRADVGFVHRKLAKFQEDMAGLYGADVGSEMLAAVQAGQEVGSRVALIDDPADVTLDRAMRELTLREKVRAVGMLVAGGAKALLPGRRNAKAEVEEELRRYQEDPATVLAEVRRKFPTVHRVVIQQRDAAMAHRIRTNLGAARHAVAVLGDGHLNGMVPLLADLKPTVYRLADVREGRLPKGLVATGTSEKVGFSFHAGLGP